MSQQANDSMRESAGAVKSGAGAAGKAAKSGLKAGKKAFSKGSKSASSLIPLKYKLIALGVVAITILIIGMREGFNEAQFDENFYNTAMHEDGTIQPEDKEEAEAATWDMGRAIHQTLDLAEIIHEAKKKELEAIKDSSGFGSTVICETDSMPILVNSEYPETYPAGGAGGGMGEKIAQTAENLAWPEGTPSSKYDWDTGGAPTPANKAAIEKWYPSQTSNRCKIVGCCCHSARVIMAEALGKKLGGTLLPNVHGNDNAIKDLQEVFEGCNFEVFKYDGKESSLRRGDLLTWAWKKPGGHTCIYIGDGKVVEGSLGQKYFSHVSDYKTLDVDLSKYNYFVVSRSKDSGSGFINGGVSTSAQQVIEGACLWAEAIANDNRFHYGGSGDSNYNGHKMGCYFCGTNEWKKPDGMTDKMFSYCCNPFVTAAYAHGGGVLEMLERCKRGSGYGMEDWSDHKDWVACGRVPYDQLQRGDVLVSEGHVALYIGNGKVCHAAYEDDNVRGSDIWNKSITADDYWHGYDRVFRYVGTGGGVMEIPAGGGTSAKYTKKDSMTTLEEITASTGKLIDIGYVSSPYSNCAQSFAYVNNAFAVSFVKTNGPPGTVQLYSKEGKYLDSARNDDILHANGACATPDGSLLVAGKLSPRVAYTAESFSISGASISSTGTKTLPRYTSSIAYDRETKKYICSAGGGMTVFDENFNEVGKVSRNMHGTYYQDIGAGHGFIFACHTTVKGSSLSHGSNYIDVYNESTGDYCGSYHVDYGELESCDVVDGELVLLVHLLGHENYIQFTGIKVADTQLGGSGGVTQSDMDILAAYSVSISNTGIYKEKEESSSILDIIGGDQSTNSYRDVTGRRLKLYWFGKNRGRVNYKRDLKAKIDGFWHNIRFYETPLRGAEAEKAMKEDGIDPATGRMSTSNDTSESFAPLVVSAYRTNEQQKSIYGDGSDPLVALPGHSEHECGLAVDIIDSKSSELIQGDPLVDEQANTPAQKWLMKNCAKYGFILRYPKNKESITKIGYEPWHYRYVGKEHAEKIMSKGLCLEEYVSSLDKKDRDWSLVLVNADNKIPSDFKVTPASINTAYIQGNAESKTIDSRVLSSLSQMLDDCKKAGSGEAVSSSSLSGDIIYIRERPIEDILRDMGLAPEDPYANSGNPSMFSAKNIDAVYGISDNSTHMLFDGTVLPGITTGAALVWGDGSLSMPLPQGFTVTSWVGYRPPEDTNGVGTTNHPGLDLAIATGTPIYCSLAGTVSKAEYYGGYGNCVIIQSPGNIEIIYAHMSKILVKPGQTISVGQNIGQVGSTGNSTGPHLHFEVHKNGKVVDPAPLLGLAK